MNHKLKEMILRGRENLKRRPAGGTWWHGWKDGSRFIEDGFACAVPMPLFLYYLSISLLAMQDKEARLINALVFKLLEPSFVEEMSRTASHVYIPQSIYQKKKSLDDMVDRGESQSIIDASFQDLHVEFHRLFFG